MTPPKRLATLQRVALALVQWGLVLPLVTVQSCNRSPPRTLSGVEHYFFTDALPLGVTLAVATLLLFVFPWRGDRSARGVAALGLRGWTASLATVIALLSPTAALFDTATPRVGYAWHGGGWGLLYLGYLGLTARLARALPPPPVDRPVSPGWGVVALLLSPLVAVALGFMANARGPVPTTPAKALGLLLCAWAIVAPLALGGLGLVRARQAGAPATRLDALWWAAVAVTLLSVFGAGLDG